MRYLGRYLDGPCHEQVFSTSHQHSVRLPQDSGRYRLARRAKTALFSHLVYVWEEAS